MIAEEIGVSERTVRTARKQSGSQDYRTCVGGPGLPVHAGWFLLLNRLFAALLAAIVIARGERRGEWYSEVV